MLGQIDQLSNEKQTIVKHQAEEIERKIKVSFNGEEHTVAAKTFLSSV